MSKHKCFIALAVFLGGLLGLQAQPPADYPPPQPPYVPPLPANADWLVAPQVSRPPDASKPSATRSGTGEILQVHTVKTGRITNIRVAYTNGANMEYWLTPEAGMMPNSQNTDVLIFSINDLRNAFAPINQDSGDSSPQNALPLSFSGFAGMGWLNGSYYDKVVFYGAGKRPCYHYAQPGKLEAWVDVATGLPAAYRDMPAGVTWLYTFAAPPSGPLALPARYQAMLDKFAALEQRRQQLEKSLR